MRIIGLCGYAGAGKDTVAQYIQEAGLNVNIKRQGFADMLKLSAARCFRPEIETVEEAVEFCNSLKAEGSDVSIYFPADYDEGIADNQIGVSGRQFLQNYGTEAHRDTFGQDFWLDNVLPVSSTIDGTVVPMRDDCDILLIPDVRFENEAQRVKDCGGEIWLVERPGQKRAGAHSSEDGISGEYISRIIQNDSSLIALKWKTVEALGLVPSPQ